MLTGSVCSTRGRSGALRVDDVSDPDAASDHEVTDQGFEELERADDGNHPGDTQTRVAA